MSFSHRNDRNEALKQVGTVVEGDPGFLLVHVHGEEPMGPESPGREGGSGKSRVEGYLYRDL